MIVVQGVARIHPDDMAAMRAASAIMVPATRAEPGCIAYAYGEDLLEPGLVHVTERWRDQAALDAHFATPHMAAFNAALGKARVLELKVTAFEVTGERVLMGG
jgi:quinol monooxygenase YgiN